MENVSSLMPVKLPPGVSFTIDTTSMILTPKNLILEAVQNGTDVDITIRMKIAGGIVNEKQVERIFSEDETHWAFEKGSTKIVKEQDDISIYVKQETGADRGTVRFTMDFLISDGKVGGAGPHLAGNSQKA